MKAPDSLKVLQRFSISDISDKNVLISPPRLFLRFSIHIGGMADLFDHKLCEFSGMIPRFHRPDGSH
jgi:hypothetical protein